MDGKTITNSYDKESEFGGILYVQDGATVTIIGNGSMYSTKGTESDYVITAKNNATVNIENGYYYSYGSANIYARTSSVINIYGGKYESAEEYYNVSYVLDILEAEPEEKRGKINVYGGEFVNYNPAENINDSDYTNKLASNEYHSIYDEETNTYTVSKHNIEKFDAKEATCEEVGWEAYEKCDDCGYTTYVEIPATDHYWVATDTYELKDGAWYEVYNCTNNECKDLVATTEIVAAIEQTPYKSLTEAYETAKAGDTIVLYQDTVLAEDLYIQTPIVLDFNKHTVEVKGVYGFRVLANVTFTNGTIINNNKDSRCIDTRTNVTIAVVNMTLTTTSNGLNQPLTVGGSDNGTTLTVNNTTINAGSCGYAIISFVKTDITIYKSKINGWSLLYLKEGSDNSVVNIANTQLVSENIHSSYSNDFGMIMLESNNNRVNIDNNSIIKVITAGSLQGVVAAPYNEEEHDYIVVRNNIVSINCKIDYDGGQLTLPLPCTNKVIVSGKEVELEYTSEDHNYEESVVAPTCKEAGYTLFECVCGDSYKEDGEGPIDHTYSTEWLQSEDGKSHVKSCTGCGDVKESEIHYGGEATKDAKPVCSLCGLEYGDKLQASTDNKTVTFDASKQGYANAQDITSINVSPIKIVFAKGTGSSTPKYYTDGTAVRTYGGNAVTISSEYTISKITLSFGKDDGSNEITTSPEGFASTEWTGSAKSVTFTIGGTKGNRRIQKIEVTYVSTVYTEVECPHSNIKENVSNNDGLTHSTVCANSKCNAVIRTATCAAVNEVNCTEDALCVCGRVMEKAHGHSYSEWATSTPADCLNAEVESRICSVCDHEETQNGDAALGHNMVMKYTETHHWTECDRKGCTEATPEEEHDGGIPTQTEKAVCDTCKQPYGELASHEHNFTNKIEEDAYLVSKATCTEDAVYYYGCTDETCKEKSEETWTLTGSALDHNEVEDKEVKPTCTKSGLTAGSHCDSCNKVFVEQEVVAATGHQYSGYESNDKQHWQVCTVCSAQTTKVNHTGSGTCECGVKMPLATFNLGENGSATHDDGKTATTYSETVDGYTLSLSGLTNIYKGARDAAGNSCLKLGASSKAGSFSFTVEDDIQQVIIYVAKYKANTTKINVNGTAYTLTKNSNDGQYDAIIVDTSTTKTINFTTVSGGYRAMIDKIEYKG